MCICENQLVIFVRSLYTPSVKDLNLLGPEKAEDLLRDLLFSEARINGLPISNFDVSSVTNLPDKGADAYVRDITGLEQEDLLKNGDTCYQVKTGRSFEPWKESSIREELFGQGNASKVENLKQWIKKSLDRNGHYILISLAHDLDNPPRREDAIAHVKNLLQECGYQNTKVDVWGPNKIIGFLGPYPSLTLQYSPFKNTPNLLTTHRQWASWDDMKKDFKVDQERRNIINNIRKELRKTDQACHIRIGGEPGIGKTKLALEATRCEDLSPFVLYVDNPSKFQDMSLMNLLTRPNNNFNIILVLDDCDRDTQTEIWNKLKHQGPRIKLISIDSEKRDIGGGTRYFEVEPLEEETIKNILREYVSEGETNRWIDLCGGSPRVAHVVGWNLQNNPEDVLRPPGTVSIWERYIAKELDPSSGEVKERKRVLSYIALFKRFGYEGKVAEEGKFISEMIQEAYPNITWERFQELVKYLRGQRILQGTRTLYITPQALHIKLWVDWWEEHGSGFNFDKLVERLGDSTLLDWFFEMFRYARESKVANQTVSYLLSDQGPFAETDLLATSREGNFFLFLAEANPKAALEFLKGKLGNKSKEELLKFTKGRRQVVHSLEMITVWKEHFKDGARLLLKLGEAENEGVANNASGVFAELFSPAWSKVAPTELPPLDRFPVLEEALKSRSKAKRKLGLKACDKALQTMHFSRTAGREYQGLRKEPDLWMPETYGDIYEYYRKVWDFLFNILDDLTEEEREEAVNILLKHSQELGRIPALNGMVIATLKDLSCRNFVDKPELLKSVKRVLHYFADEMTDPVKKKWKDLENDLTDDDYHSRMQYYLTMDLAPERFEESETEIEKQTEVLAEESLQNPDRLFQEMDWITTNRVKRGYQFGYKLGQKDNDFSLLSELLQAHKVRKIEDNGLQLLGGYFRALFERNQEAWEEKIKELSDDPEMQIIVPELLRTSGLTETTSDLVLGLADTGVMEIKKFNKFARCRELNEKQFKQWVHFLIDNSDPHSKPAALFLIDFYYLRNDSPLELPEEITLELLTHPAFFEEAENYIFDQMTPYSWNHIAKAFIDSYPDSAKEIGEKLIDSFGVPDSIVESEQSSALKALQIIMEKNSVQLWKKIKVLIGPPIDRCAHHLTNWLKGGMFESPEKAPLDLIPKEAIWDWVDEDIENRAWYLGNFVPKRFSSEVWEDSLARELLVRYGDREDVRNNLNANFFTDGWMGKASTYYKNKKKKLSELEGQESNANVINWLNETIREIDNYIEYSEVREEREDY